MRVYIAGPMSGVPRYNKPRFLAAEERLKIKYPHALIYNPMQCDIEAGCDPDDMPADTDWWSLPPGMDIRHIAELDLTTVTICTHIYLLEGWERSSLGRAEAMTAYACRLDFLYEDTHDTRPMRISEFLGRVLEGATC